MQHRFDLIVGMVTEGYMRTCLLCAYALNKSKASLAGDVFQRATLLSNTKLNTLDGNWQVQLLRKRVNEVCIPVRLAPAQSVVQVGNMKFKGLRRAKAVEGVQQNDRVHSARNANHDFRTRRKQAVALDVGLQAL